MLDYDETNPNYYLSIGMFTYPFYLLQQKWGMEEAYGLYIAAARNCWAPTMNHTQLAQCLKQQAALISTEKEADVVAAFKVVKIKLFDEGVLSHYQFTKSKLRTQFTDGSDINNHVSKWLWDFGDGQTSTEKNPQHTYASSGDYRVKLTIENSGGYKDDLTRSVSVTDQYCRITAGYPAKNDIAEVIINGTVLNFDANEWDYSATPIALTGPNNKTLSLNIEGVSSDVVEETIKWTVWLDINDDGLYSRDEIIIEEPIAEDLPYGVEISKDLSDFIADANVTAGEAKFVRIIGEHTLVDACSSAVGEAFDIRVVW
jgi:hypothetical protein